jgi:sterol desaturase/sphingolipid hydroxylase (fatty acid hydroxylase superfamily)
MRSDDGNIEEFFVSLITGLMGLMLIALWLLITYGVVIMVFRHAFIELLNPFELLPIEWRQKFPYLMPQGSH